MPGGRPALLPPLFLGHGRQHASPLGLLMTGWKDKGEEARVKRTTTSMLSPRSCVMPPVHTSAARQHLLSHLSSRPCLFYFVFCLSSCLGFSVYPVAWSLEQRLVFGNVITK